MSARARGLRLPGDLEREIEREVAERGQSWSSTALDLLSEGVRMRRRPGIVFADGPTGRRAVVAGTGLDVWELIRTWQDGGEGFEETKAKLPLACSSYRLRYPRRIPAASRGL